MTSVVCTVNKIWTVNKTVGWCLMLVVGWAHLVAQVEVFFSSDNLQVMSHFLCIIIMCIFDLIVSL